MKYRAIVKNILNSWLSDGEDSASELYHELESALRSIQPAANYFYMDVK